MQWMMLQQEEADDFVIATGKQISVREFVRMSAAEAGIILKFSGDGLEEVATVVSVKGDNAPGAKVGDVIVKVDPRYFRPTEVELLIGDPTKAKEQLGWKPKYDLASLTAEMVRSDIELFRRDRLLKDAGFSVKNEFE